MEKIENSLYEIEKNIVEKSKEYLEVKDILMSYHIEIVLRNAIRQTYYKTKDKYLKDTSKRPVQLPLF